MTLRNISQLRKSDELRGWHRAAIISIMLALLFAVALPITGQSAKDLPLIHHASVQPTKVHPGDTMVVTAEVSDSSGIESVTADMGGIETIYLSLIEGSIYHGIWQGQWLVHDTGARDYVTTIVATNSLGKSATRDVLWRDPQTYERYHQTNNTQQYTTNTTWQDALTITFTPNVTQDFLAIGVGQISNSSTSYYTEAQFIYDTNVVNTMQLTPDLTTEKVDFNAYDVVTLTAGTPYTFKTQYGTENAAGTAGISQCRTIIFAVSDYHHAENETATSTNSITYQDKVTLTFTPATAGDYFILGIMELTEDSAQRSCYGQFYNTTNSTSYGEVVRKPTVASQYATYGIFKKVSLSAESYTFKIQYKSSATQGNAHIRNARLTAVRISDLGDVAAYGDADNETSTTSTSYVTKLTINYDTTTYENHFRPGLRILGGSSTSKISYTAVFENTVMRQERQMRPNDSTDRVTLMGVRFSAENNSPYTLEQKYRAESPATAYANTFRNMALRGDTLTPFNDSGHTTYDNNFQAGENTVYIQGCFFNNSDNFTVAYYDGGPFGDGVDGAQVTADSIMSDANGVLNSQWYFPGDTGATAGTWHAVVYDDSVSIPSANYTANDPNSFRECAFTVASEAIPEFPTVMAGIVVAGLCFGAYYWMRKRRLAYVKA